MQNVFTDYPEIPWKPGWLLSSGPDDAAPFITSLPCGKISVPDFDCSLQIIQPSISCHVRFLCNGLSVSARKKPLDNRVDIFVTAPGLLCGTASGLPAPELITGTGLITQNDASWIQSGQQTVLLLRRKNRFVLVHGNFPPEIALDRAETALEEPFIQRLQDETEDRKAILNLFGVNPRHNPPVALAAELLQSRLRRKTGLFCGLWSVADGFKTETFSLNELYPLIRAWKLIDPDIAIELVQTALGLQQSSGGFPAWVEPAGLTATFAPWPFIIQSFEMAWSHHRDPALFQKTLPALRKYIQWAVRYFDPHRDRIPAWQNAQEVFIPENFERGKASPDLTVLLIAEMDALLRLCEHSEHTETFTESLREERNHLEQTLYTVFWNPELKAFSNVWKDGHYLHQPSFGSFMPLFLPELDGEKQAALIEAFNDTHGFPGHQTPASWKQEEIDDTAHFPAIHQLIAFEAFRRTNRSRPQMQLLIRRTRESFAAWFEQESIEAARDAEQNRNVSRPPYALGPVVSALVLAVQNEFQLDATRAPSSAQSFLRGFHRLRFERSDVRILFVCLFAAFIVHLAYHLPKSHNADTRLAEAALNYRQGRYSDTLRICRNYPDHPLSLFLQANLLMITEQPEKAENLYHQALSRRTESPSALFGYALSLQMNGKFDEAVKRYNDFLDIYETRQPHAAALAEEFLRLSNEHFRQPPHWKNVFSLPMMNDLGL